MPHQRPPACRPGLLRTRFMLPLHAGLLLLFVATAIGCERRVREFPEELIGRWETSHPMYRETYMEFSLEEFVLGTLEGPVTYELERIETEEVPGETRHIIHYRSEGERYSMPLTYTPGNGGTLISPNQQSLIWRKVRSP